ncbi:hypothetical protein L2Y94_14540 [Luteibacter aegosomatis]|uniref:hypothetical protein n=1 Tax=Luteibacter aegosomatis TaxID=2911537 RepID=UPI001FF8A405|nr:hypothetical protein [Luteibacter aegosomatis]UPG84547.1 hypothetical protein L2Y94_14540 [Luteibacter aegosomatis]
MDKIVYELAVGDITGIGCVKDDRSSFDFIDAELRVKAITPLISDSRLSEFTWAVRFAATEDPLQLAWSASEQKIYLAVSITPSAFLWIRDRGFTPYSQLILKVEPLEGALGIVQSAELRL